MFGLDGQHRFKSANRPLQVALLLHREPQLLVDLRIAGPALEDGTKLRQSRVRFTLGSQRNPQVHSELRILAVKGHRLLEGGHRCFHVAGLREHRTEIVPGANEVRPQRHRLAKRRNGVHQLTPAKVV